MSKMIKILFVCHGNICRSPMAEFIMKKLVSDAGLADRFDIASAATSSEELGNPVYPPARRKLAEHGIGCAGKTARRITADDYTKYDLLIGMDYANMRNMTRAFGGDSEAKLKMLMDYTSRPGEVSDPWYSGDFNRAYIDIEEGCRGLQEESGDLLVAFLFCHRRKVGVLVSCLGFACKRSFQVLFGLGTCVRICGGSSLLNLFEYRCGLFADGALEIICHRAFVNISADSATPFFHIKILLENK